MCSSDLAPRLTAWHGDSDASYKYSGQEHEPLPWIEPLTAIKNRISIFIRANFNSVLANFYRDGQDSIGWHSDNEKELGPCPIIASVSFGATRIIKFRNQEKQSVSVSLNTGSLLIMSGATQSFWQHSISKTKKEIAPRINLTFRNILNPQTKF